MLERESDEHAVTKSEKERTLAAVLERVRQARENGDLAGAVRFLNRAGRLHQRLSLPAAALADYSEARALLLQAPNPELEAYTLAGEGEVLSSQGNCEASATPTLNKAISLSKAHGFLRSQAEALLVLADCQRNNDHAEALTTAEAALSLAQAAGDRWLTGKAHQSIGEYQLSQTRLVEATANFETALGLWRELELVAEQAEAIISLGFVEYRKGAWQPALDHFARAQAMLDEESEPFKMGQITGTTGEALLESGLPEQALPVFQRSSEYFTRAQRPRGVAVIAWDLGRTYYFLRDYPQAITQLQSAISAANAVNDQVLVARCEDFLGRAYAALGDHAAALEHYEAAIQLFEQAHDRLEVARTKALIGKVYQSQRRIEQARNQYQIALQTFDELTDRPNQAVTLFALGDLELAQGRLDPAEDYLRRSIEVTEKIRQATQTTDLTAAFSATVYDRYEKYVECLMRIHAAQPDRGLAIKAFETSELGRGRSLAELLRGADTDLARDLTPELAERERILRQLLRVKADQQIELLGRSTYKKEELDALTAEQTQLESEYQQVTDAIRQQHPSFGEIVRPAAWTLRQIQDQVLTDDQTVLLEYSLGQEKSYVWVVTRDGFASYELPGREQIMTVAQSVYRLMSDSQHTGSVGELNAAQQELSRMILRPVAAQLNKPRIIVVADGVLNYIPFQSLPDPADNAHLLVERYELINAASASILGALGKESALRPAPTKLLAAFGDPVFPSNFTQVKASGADTVLMAENGGDGNERWRHALRDIEIDADSPNTADIQPLIYSKQELANLRSVGGGDSLIASEFNASRENVLRTDLSQYSILHFATHGFLDPKRPENSGLVLSTVDSERKPLNGYLGLQDIYSLRAPVDLVVLSACRTGLGKDVKGEGLIGLTRGFMYAGASTVVASLWKVDDEATAELMKEFYANLLERGMTPAAALRAAQNTIRSKPQWSSPYYWAAFTIQGEYRTPIRTTRAPMAPGLAKRVTIAAAILGFLTFIAWWSRRRLSASGLAG